MHCLKFGPHYSLNHFGSHHEGRIMGIFLSKSASFLRSYTIARNDICIEEVWGIRRKIPFGSLLVRAFDFVLG